MTMLIWGVWILIPIVLDGIGALLRTVSVLFSSHSTDITKYKDEQLPTVSVVIPAYNEEELIERCINSVKAQDYPNSKLEIIVVDDGSLDHTAKIAMANINGEGEKKVFLNGEFMSVDKFGGNIVLFTEMRNRGKSHALNTGISHAHGDIIFTVDSDAVLEPLALRHMATYLLDNPKKGAACGVVEVNWHLTPERDDDARIMRDEDGKIIEKKLSFFETMLSKSQFLEYLNSFRLGRHYQSIVHSEFMLSGAFSAFRKEVLEKTHMYSDLTVAEDFDISMDLHQNGVDIGYCPDAKVWVEPLTDLGSLYAQRLRWRRGQLEVVGVHKNMVGSNKFGVFGRLGIPSMLMIDHTLAFPRILWMFLLLCFPLFGYSQRLVALFFVVLYVFYVLFDVAQTLATYTISDKDTKGAINDAFHYVLLLPVYRLIIFYFRMSGYLVVFKEPQLWKANWPFEGVRDHVNGVQHRIAVSTNSIVGFMYSLLDIFKL
jgi:putative glycosyltransferase (exosortase G-associated)